MSARDRIRDNSEIDRLYSDAMSESAAYAANLPIINDEETVLASAKEIMVRMVEFKELMMMNACAIKEVKTKFEILNTEFNLKNHRNPIHSINTRLKSIASINSKLERQGLEFSIENVAHGMNDIAGIRVICSYIDDIYTIADALLSQDDVTYISKKDYIRTPKPNGYRSLHLIISIPVFFADKKQNMAVEVQIRTIAMDFWASLEHQLRYKDDNEIAPEIVNRLRECADSISEIDKEMLKIRGDIEAMSDKPTEEEILLERFSRMDQQFN